MEMNQTIFLGGSDTGLSGKPDTPQGLALGIANRHGLVAGATGTGKTVTLQVMAQSFAGHGVPVFVADVKGDLSGLAMPGSPGHKAHEALLSRAAMIGMESLEYAPANVIFWDLFARTGHPVRTTISQMGPALLSRLMSLTAAQEGVLNIAFQYADDNGLLLLDLKDLRSLLLHLGTSDVRKATSLTYGNIAPASLAAVQRNLLVLEREGADLFFGEPGLDLKDFMRIRPDGNAYINILDATRLISKPRLYSTFLLWMLSELFEELPEIGDPEKPRLVFFFDEAHLLFADINPALLQKVEQVVRLIRSKGVGIYFVTQNPRDIPETVLAQLGNRIQHALRAYTPMEQKAVRAAADSFRPNPAFRTDEMITQLGTGEALVSTLDQKGRPSIVQRTLIRPPASRLGPVSEEERLAIRQASPVAGIYDTAIDRQSAHEHLQSRQAEAALPPDEAPATKRKGSAGKAPRRRKRLSPGERAVNSAMSTAGRELTRYILRGIFGNMKR